MSLKELARNGDTGQSRATGGAPRGDIAPLRPLVAQAPTVWNQQRERAAATQAGHGSARFRTGPLNLAIPVAQVFDRGMFPRRAGYKEAKPPLVGLVAYGRRAVTVALGGALASTESSSLATTKV